MNTPAESSRSTLSYFTFAISLTFVGLALSAVLGWYYHGTISGMLSIFFICSVLAVLEISLSFDNAIVNANKLKTMRPEWRRRFLTWGIIIAVFGMRIIFPLIIVMIGTGIGPIDAVELAATQPDEYSRIMEESYLWISAFGGTFLLMVGLTYFFDEEKDVHWVAWIEEKVAASATIRGVEIALVLLIVLGVSSALGEELGSVFMRSAIIGLLTFLGVEILGKVLDSSGEAETGSGSGAMVTGGLGAFLYLEVLDASFSFDGVIGAFALSRNLFVIAIGLGIGALYVRSLTIMLVERESLSEYRFLEHGAFYAIIALSIAMYAQLFVHVPEVITGLGGATVIGLAFWSSLRWNKRNPGA